MAHIFREKCEIPIPEDAHINHNDGRVFVFLREGNVLQKSRRKVIGRAASNTTMYPNVNFKFMYPALWEEHYGRKDRLPSRFPHVGLYALCLGTGHQTGVYPLLHDVCGPVYSNAIMDFVMHSMLTRTDVAETFPEIMRDEVTFSTDVPTNEWLTELFTSYITEDMRETFCSEWLDRCREDGTAEAWISIDGSNIDCSASECEIAEKGHAKSRKNADVVSFMYAINAETGMPIAYDIYNGSKVDSKAFMKMSAKLKSQSIKAKGVILDRGFCTADVFNELEKDGIPYVIMLKSDTHGHTEMYNKAGNDICWNLKYLINDESLFGISSEEKSRVFKNNDICSYVSLFYDGMNGADRKSTLIRKVMREAARVMEKIREGENACILSEFERYLSITDNNGSKKVAFKYNRWQEDLNAKGFYSIATSECHGAEETSRLYDFRDRSETQYMFQKTQIGFDVMRVQSEAAVKNKFFICFIASIIRNRIMHHSRSSKAGNVIYSNTNKAIVDINRLCLSLMEGESYVAVHDESGKQKQLLEMAGILPSDLELIAEEVNMRKGPIASLFRQMPNRENNTDGRKKKKKAEKEDKPKRPVGRPKGSGKKKEVTDEVKPKKKPGRPKGSLNKKTLEAMKRGKGRPKGSKNKTTLEREAAEAAALANLPKRKPGRPKGSLNKKTLQAMKRSKGRPKGSKNKIELERQ